MQRPRLIRASSLLLGIALALAACGGGDGGDAGAAAGSALPAQSQVTVTPETAATPFTLQAGRYKFGWAAPDCTKVDFTMAGQSKGYTFAKKSSLKSFSSIMSGVLDDTYLLTQADPSCTAWTVTIDRMGA